MPKSACRERLFFGSKYVHYYTSLPGVSSSSSTTDLTMVLHGLASNAGAYSTTSPALCKPRALATRPCWHPSLVPRAMGAAQALSARLVTYLLAV